MKYDVTERVQEAWAYYDTLLDERIKEIASICGAQEDQFVKINPAEFCEKNKYQKIRNYEYKNIRDFIRENKKEHVYLISPLDAVEETAAQIGYKDGTEIRRTIRASKCEAVPVGTELAQDFFIRNHRQSAPHISAKSICYGLLFKGELVAVMLYDESHGAVRGRKRNYELVRLSIAKGTRIHGAASKLQMACEETLRTLGEKEIYSYSNATINSGAVYEKLGFSEGKIEGGQPHVILTNNKITRLINLYPNSTDLELAKRNWVKTHVGGNRMHIKKI